MGQRKIMEIRRYLECVTTKILSINADKVRSSEKLYP